MGMRKGWLRSNHSTRGPSAFVFFDVETTPKWIRGTRPTIAHVFRLGCARYVRLSGTRIVRDRRLRFTHPDQFWDWSGRFLEKKRTLWFVAHNLPFDFREVNGWEVIENNNPTRWRFALKDPPIILKGTISGRRVLFVDSMNFFPSKLSELGQTFGPEKLPMPPYHAPDSDWFRYCERDVDVLAGAMLGLRQWVYDNDLGVMGKTAAQCAYHAYTHRFYDVPIRPHRDPELSRFERKAYYGGQAECYRVGPVPGRVWELDVHSFYPSIMLSGEFPCIYRTSRSTMPVDDADRWCQKWGGIAEVIIDTFDRTYPVRVDAKTLRTAYGMRSYTIPAGMGGREVIYYPIGRYRTWLAGSELREALARGHVTHVGRSAWYECGQLFPSFVRTLTSWRRESKRDGRPAISTLTRLLLNSLSGYFGKRSATWEPMPGIVPPMSWGRGWMTHPQTGETHNARYIAGQMQIETGDRDGWETFVAISAFITAAGRQWMRRAKQIAGWENVHYQHTDAMLVNDTGFDNLILAGLVGKDELGKFNLISESEGCVIHGLNNLVLDRRRVVPGMKPSTIADLDGRYMEWRFDKVWDSIAAQGHPDVLQRLVCVRNESIDETGCEHIDGEVLPPLLLLSSEQ